MKSTKTFYILMASLILSLFVNIVFINNFMSSNNQLKNLYLRSLERLEEVVMGEMIQASSPWEEKASLDNQSQVIGFTTGVGLALDQLTLRYSAHYSSLTSQLQVILINEEYSNEEKLAIIKIFYKHIDKLKIKEAYNEIKKELREKNLVEGYYLF